MSDGIDVSSQEFKDAVAAAVEEATDGLKAKNTELLGKLKKAQQGQQIDPADLQAAEAERDEWKGKALAAEKAAKKAATDLDAATKRADEADSAFNNSLRDAALTSALTEAGVTSPALVKAAKAMFRDSAQVVVEGDARIVKMGDKPLSDSIAEWAGSDEGKHFVTATHGNGGGSQGGNRAPTTSPGSFGGSRSEREAAISARFPDLPK